MKPSIDFAGEIFRIQSGTGSLRIPNLDDKRPKIKAPVSQFHTTNKMEIVLAKSADKMYQVRKGIVITIKPRIQCHLSIHVNIPTTQQRTRWKRESPVMCAKSNETAQNISREEAERSCGVDGFSCFGSNKLYSQVAKP
eukprot:scaffold1034_cov127-Cylindrotheca_fusiformis.AAC.38